MSKFYSALFVSSTCFRPHRSIIRSVLYKLYSQTLVSGNTRTTRHVQPIRSCRKNFATCVRACARVCGDACARVCVGVGGARARVRVRVRERERETFNNYHG